MKSVYKDRSLANCPNQFNLAEYILEKSCKNPTKSALEIVSRTGKQSVSFDELKNRILRTGNNLICLLYTSPSPRDRYGSRMPSSA